MQAISVQQPWAFAIASSGKAIANRPDPTPYRGPLLIHASMRVDLKACDHPLIQSGGWDPTHPLATIGAVIATADLADICSATPCTCGPWATPTKHHWRLTNINPLPRPIVALGHPHLWQPPPTLTNQINTMLPTPTPNNTP